MMPSWISVGALVLAILQVTAPSAPHAAVSAQAFAGTWVGTQHWDIANPPPGANTDQPVSITIDVTDGKIAGTLTPFMGGEDGATFVEARIVGEELQASAVFARPRPDAGAAAAAPAKTAIVDEDEGAPRIVPAGRKGRPTWKDAITIHFTFKADRLDMKGTADVAMNDVKWLKFSYDLSKKRARY
jgi:hypothetical protein